MIKVAEYSNYSYYFGYDNKKGFYYNICPSSHSIPKGGYYSHEYIAKVKNVPDLFIHPKSIL